MLIFIVSLQVSIDCAPRADALDAAGIAYANAQEKIRMGNIPEGTQRLHDLLKAIPWFSQAYWAIGRAEDARNNFIGAYTAYKRFLRSDINDEDRSEIRRRVKDLEAKVTTLRMYAEGERAAQSKRWADTVEVMNQVIIQKPKFALPYRLLGIAHAAQNNASAAVEAYQKYLFIDPETPDRIEIQRFLAEYLAVRETKP